MKILVSADFTSHSTQSMLSRAYAAALLSSGHEVVLDDPTTRSGKEDPWVLENSNRPDGWKADLHLLGTWPHLYSSALYCSSVAVFDWNTDKLPNNNYGPKSDWIHRLNLTDFILASSPNIADVLHTNGVVTSSKVIPYPVESTFYTEPPEQLYDAHRAPLHTGWFKFVSFLNLDQESDYKSLLLGYLTSFSIEEVALVLYVREDSERARLSKYIEEFRKSLKLRHKPSRIFIVPSVLSERDEVQLLRSCHCYVTATRSTGLSIDITKALCAGLPVIAADDVGRSNEVSEANGYLVESYQEPVYNVPKDSWNYTDQLWPRIDIHALQTTLQKAYQYRTSLANKSKEAAKSLHSHTTEAVVKQLDNALEGIVASARCEEAKTPKASS